MNKWMIAQKEESGFWGNCANTLNEELKQLVYAKYMGLSFTHDGNTPYNLDIGNKSIIDIGGGPVSLLLKTKPNKKERIVVDPCKFPEWVSDRYLSADISFFDGIKKVYKGLPKKKVDEVWIYNVLSHTEDPEEILNWAKHVSKKIRIFEWLNDRQNDLHIQSITQADLQFWLGKVGRVVRLNGENECYGTAFYGDFDYD
jgi:hypothetical protein